MMQYVGIISWMVAGGCGIADEPEVASDSGGVVKPALDLDDPNDAGCTGFIAKSMNFPGIGLIQLMGTHTTSAHCDGKMWALVEQTRAGMFFEVANLGDPQSIQSFHVPSGSTFGWTDMVPGSAVACVQDSSHCTAIGHD